MRKTHQACGTAIVGRRGRGARRRLPTAAVKRQIVAPGAAGEFLVLRRRAVGRNLRQDGYRFALAIMARFGQGCGGKRTGALSIQVRPRASAPCPRQEGRGTGSPTGIKAWTGRHDQEAGASAAGFRTDFTPDRTRRSSRIDGCDPNDGGSPGHRRLRPAGRTHGPHRQDRAWGAGRARTRTGHEQARHGKPV